MLPEVEQDGAQWQAGGDAHLHHSGRLLGEREHAEPQAVVRDGAGRRQHARAGVEQLAVADGPADAAPGRIEPPGGAAGVDDLAVRRPALGQEPRHRAERDREAVAGNALAEPAQRRVLELLADPVVVVQDRCIDAHAGEGRAAPVAGEEIEPADAVDLTADVAGQVLDVPARLRPDHLGHRVPGPQRQDAEARRTGGAAFGGLEDPVHPGDEGPVASAREDRAVPPGDDLLGDLDRVGGAPGEIQVLVRQDGGQRAAHARVHLLGMGVEEDRNLPPGARAGRGIRRTRARLCCAQHPLHPRPPGAMTQMSELLSKPGATVRRTLNVRVFNTVRCPSALGGEPCDALPGWRCVESYAPSGWRAGPRIRV